MQGIGVDADQAYLGPQVLTSALKKVDVAVLDTIKRAQAGKFNGGADTIFDGQVRRRRASARPTTAGQKYADRSSRSRTRSPTARSATSRTRSAGK